MSRATSSTPPTAAVDAFLDAAPDDVAIGLVTFAGKVDEIDRAHHRPRRRRAPRSTALELDARAPSVYDAIAPGVELVGDEGSRSLLVLSDGADTGSDTTLDGRAAARAADAGVVVDVVVAGSSRRGRRLCDASPTTPAGAVIPADPSALEHGLRRAGRRPRPAAARDASSVPADVERRGDRSPSRVAAGGTTYADSAFVSLGDAAATGPRRRRVRQGRWSARPSCWSAPSRCSSGSPALLVGRRSPGRGRKSLGRAAARRLLRRRRRRSPGEAPQVGAQPSQPTSRTRAVALTDKVVNADLETGSPSAWPVPARP